MSEQPFCDCWRDGGSSASMNCKICFPVAEQPTPIYKAAWQKVMLPIDTAQDRFTAEWERIDCGIRYAISKREMLYSFAINDRDMADEIVNTLRSHDLVVEQRLYHYRVSGWDV